MKYALIYNMQRTVYSLESEQKYAKSGIHDLYIGLIYTELCNRDKKVAVEFNTNINQLKTLRVINDYDEESEEFSHGWQSIWLAKSVIEILKTNFKIDINI